MIAFVQVLVDQRKKTAVAFPEAAVAYFAKLGVRIERVMTDNGSCYRSKLFRAACKRFGLRQIFTRPYTPKTNGKAERFIQTALREWAYARAYHNSDQRSAELLHWLGNPTKSARAEHALAYVFRNRPKKHKDWRS